MIYTLSTVSCGLYYTLHIQLYSAANHIWWEAVYEPTLPSNSPRGMELGQKKKNSTASTRKEQKYYHNIDCDGKGRIIIRR